MLYVSKSEHPAALRALTADEPPARLLQISPRPADHRRGNAGTRRARERNLERLHHRLLKNVPSQLGVRLDDLSQQLVVHRSNQAAPYACIDKSMCRHPPPAFQRGHADPEGYSSFKDFSIAMLNFLRDDVPRNWRTYCDEVTDNFRVIDPKKFRIIV